MRMSADGYDYIYTHVDDSKIVENPWNTGLIYFLKQSGPPEYYLGNDYRYEDNENLWTMGCMTYAKEAVRKIEEIKGTLRKEKTPLPVDDCHPELDQSPLLGESEHIFNS